MSLRLANVVWVAAISLVTQGGCATGALRTPRPRIADFGGVSFDDTEVWAPTVRIGMRSDGTWAGKMDGRVVDASVHGDEVVIDASVNELTWTSTPTTRIRVEPVSEGYLIDYKGLFKELVVLCAFGDRACGATATRRTDLRQRYACSGVYPLYGSQKPDQPPTAQLALSVFESYWRFK